jgi:type II secretory ATPase GspE/PulE/Tfp pilus assembly ATPase PilB-like protein
MYQPSVDELLKARVSPDVAAASDGMAFYRKRGCPRCGQTGYKGRVGIYQLLTMTEELLKARVSPDVAAASDGMAFYRKRGCPRCGQTGYKGRVGIYQLLTMTEELQQLASNKASREEIERSAISSGMRTMWDDGLAKVAAGLTSVEEVARVVA